MPALESVLILKLDPFGLVFSTELIPQLFRLLDIHHGSDPGEPLVEVIGTKRIPPVQIQHLSKWITLDRIAE